MRVRFAEDAIYPAPLQRLADALDGMNRRSAGKPANTAMGRYRLDGHFDASGEIGHCKLNRQFALSDFT